MKVFLSCLIIVFGTTYAESQDGVCYNAAGEAVRCIPDFINIAFQAQVFASNTCGDSPSEFCVQQEIGLPPQDDNCYVCDKESPTDKHPPSYLTDRNEVDNQTWWQSNTLFDENIENMTLHLPFNKSFDIEYIKIEFQSPRPESMLIEKSSDYGRSWEVYQYFSSSCYKTFNKRTDEDIYAWDETKAICTSSYSEISPLQGGVVAFSPLKDRPSAKDTDKLYSTPLLLSWMRATDIRFRLMRLNTFGDQYFSDERNAVLKTYFYAISDLSVGGRCTCHGHGGSCTKEACLCEHNTAGRNCERCMDMFNDMPWKQSTMEEPFVCQECNCNGLASRCVFDEDVYVKSENITGGACIGCRANTAGQQCELCAHGYYPNPLLEPGHYDRCQACQCNVYGSVGDGACAQELDVNRGLSFGDCQCKPHVQGVQCNTCEDGYHTLQEGCLRCDCDPVGTSGDTKLCDKTDGQCTCMDNIAGQNCNECLPGYWNYLSGCEACNCDVAGSTTKLCDQSTGQCECIPGMQGLDCSQTVPGTFKPDIDTVIIKPIVVSEPVIDGGSVDGPTGTATTDLGIDNIQYSEARISDADDEVLFSFTVPRDDSYTIVVKYSYPGSGDANLRFDVTSDLAPEDIAKCETRQVQAYTGNVAASDNGIYKLLESCLDDGVTYTLRVALQDDIPDAFNLLGLLLIPTPSPEVLQKLEDLFENQEGGQQALQHCLDLIATVSAQQLEAQYPECVMVSDIIVNDITNGSVSCDCNILGANNPDSCERVGGQCACKVNVYGLKCDTCLPGYHSLSMSGCEACNCSQIGSSNIYCDVETGECRCKEGITGVKCTECKENMYSFSSRGCSHCNCSETGSTSLQCDLKYGECPCKAGITGIHCDRCEDGYYDFSASGCTPCDCNSIGGSNLCDPDSGECRCKDNVEGGRCLKCKNNAFSLQQSNPDGCQECFCFNHTDQCIGDISYSPTKLSSDFKEDDDGWKYRISDASQLLPVEYILMFEHIRLSNTASTPSSYCFVAPDKYTGNQLASFLTQLKFTYNSIGTRSGISEVVIRGNPYTLTLIPRVNPGDRYSTLLHHSGSWLISKTGDTTKTDRLTAHMVQSVLGDIVSLEICATVYENEALYLEEFSIGGVEMKTGKKKEKTAYNVELCTCPEGYTGSFCEDCSVGYKRSDPSLGRLSSCVPCECNGYSDTCDSGTGECIDCADHTTGHMCQVCEDGYYGQPGYGNPSSCKICMCPEVERSFSNTCEIRDGRMVCTNCTRGHTGDRCDECEDGFYGEPGYDNPNEQCTECTCNGNIDVAADDNCNTVTGQCLKCIDHTAGRYCDECARGYYGDAIIAKNCSKCMCDSAGSRNQYLCDVETGQCSCKPNVVERDCDRCRAGYYDLESGLGCTACDCDLLGSADLQCSDDGACLCRPGYFGTRCNQCSANSYYDVIRGCTACNCNPAGSESQQCDETGQCICKGTVQGKQCDTCPRNMVNITEGCVNCPDCYSLVEREVDMLKEKLVELKELMAGVDTPTIEASPDFRNQINEVQAAVQDTFAKANQTAALSRNLNNARKEIEGLIETLQREIEETDGIVADVALTVTSSERNLSDAKKAIDKILVDLEDGVKLLLDEGEAALQRAEENMNNLSEENVDMQHKANLARRLAQEQEEKSQETVDMAQEAQDLSANALNTAKTARDTLRDTQNQLARLTVDIGELKEAYELANTAATNYISRAEDTLQAARQLENEACNADNSIDLQDLQDTLIRLDEMATDAAQNARGLQQRASDMKESARDTIGEAEDLLEDGEEGDRGMSQLKSAAEDAFEQSEAAVQECTDLIADAEKLLEVLQNFEREVDAAKDKAQNAIAELDVLEEALGAAEAKVEKAEEKLGDGKRDMSVVLESIVEAKGNLQLSLNNAKQVTDKISGLLTSSQNVAGDASTLREDVAGALLEIRRLREEARNGTELLKGVLREADDTKAVADSVASTLETGDRKLKSLQDQLDQIDTMDSQRLSELIGELTSAGDKLDNSGIDDKIEEMRTVSVEQEDKIAQYRAQIQLMREEISTLEKIESEIPDDSACYNPNNA